MGYSTGNKINAWKEMLATLLLCNKSIKKYLNFWFLLCN